MEFITQYSSPLGPMTMRSDGTHLTDLSFGEAERVSPDSPDFWEPVKSWLDLYFEGRDPGIFPVPICPAGTAFQKRVWARARAIPYGETVSYGHLAKQLSSAMSPQAVGRAVGKNPIAILIPCHRVLGAGGALTGYAYGLEAKKFLLSLEGIPFQP